MWTFGVKFCGLANSVHLWQHWTPISLVLKLWPSIFATTIVPKTNSVPCRVKPGTYLSSSFNPIFFKSVFGNISMTKFRTLCCVWNIRDVVLTRRERPCCVGRNIFVNPVNNFTPRDEAWQVSSLESNHDWPIWRTFLRALCFNTQLSAATYSAGHSSASPARKSSTPAADNACLLFSVVAARSTVYNSRGL